MSWEKIEDHLFEKHCVEGEDKELCNLMSEHDAEIRAKAIDELTEEAMKQFGEETHGKRNNIRNICSTVFAVGSCGAVV